MESRKAKIEKFFGSNEKLEAIANNKEFIEKVAGGQATPETYQKELGKLGLELTLEEAKEVQTATERAMDIPPEKLDEAVLESVAGGLRGAVCTGVNILASVAGMASLGCGIANTVYRFKTHSALNRGDWERGKEYSKLSLQLLGAAVGLFVGAGVLCAISECASPPEEVAECA